MGNSDKEAELKLYYSDRLSSLHQGLTNDAHASTHLLFTYYYLCKRRELT